MPVFVHLRSPRRLARAIELLVYIFELMAIGHYHLAELLWVR
jgi:hypothetical protein